MRIVVTGGAGFIASNLIPRLLSQGHEVLAVDNLFLGKREHVEPFASNPRFRFVELDLVGREATAALFASFEPERVWHLAANSDISFGTIHTDVDLKAGTIVTYNVLDAMRLAGTKEIIFSSSGAMYGEPTVMPTPENYGPLLPISLYAASKLACEGLITAYAHNYDMKAWIFRFGNIVGPNPTHGAIYDFVLKLAKDPTKLPVLGDGKQSKPYVYVDDCLDGIEFGQSHSNDEVNYFNLTVDGWTSVAQIAEATLRAMKLEGTPIVYSGGSRGWRGDIPTVRLDGSKIAKLGWVPKLTSHEAVERAARDAAEKYGRSG